VIKQKESKATLKATIHIPSKSTPKDIQTERMNKENSDSLKLISVSSENARLKNELADTLETVSILKQVISDYAKKK